MSEAIWESSEDASPAAVGADTPPTAGAMLRAAREAAGLHIAALAVSLKVPVKKLEALEQDQFEALSDSVFVRALAASVCRTLKIDPAPVLARLPPGMAAVLSARGPTINTPFRAATDGAGASAWSRLTHPAALVVFALLLGALILVFLPLPAVDEATSPSTSQTTTEPSAEAAPQREAPMTDAPEAANLLAPLGQSTGAPEAVLLPSAAAVAPLAAQAAATEAGLITFSATGVSWVQVTDAKGVVQMNRTLAAGDSAGASGVLPLSVVIGRADVTQVQVRGQAFAVTGVSKDGVARFEVK